MTMFAFEPSAQRTGYDRARAEENLVYREIEGLDIHGGFMLVYEQFCRITMKSTLSDEEKYCGTDHMLRYRQTLQEQHGGVYWWFADGADKVQYSYTETPARVRMLKRVHTLSLARKLRQGRRRCKNDMPHR